MKNVKVGDVLDAIYAFAPYELKDEYDNIGLMLGAKSRAVTGVTVALDCTLDTVDEAIANGSNVIVAHHPLLFHAVGCIDTEIGNGAVIEKCLAAKIAVIAAHTNVDKAEKGLNFALANALGGKNVKVTTPTCGVLFDVDGITLADFARNVKAKLNDKYVVYAGNAERKINRVFACSGGGGGERGLYNYALQNADVYLSGDFRHHNYIDAGNDNFALVGFSHYASEILVEKVLSDLLTTQFDGLKVYASEQKCPFELV